MILACPFCNSRFLVPASLFASGPRQVRCARCRHSWKAEATESVEEQHPAPEPISAEPSVPLPAPHAPVITMEDVKHHIHEMDVALHKANDRWKALPPNVRHYAKIAFRIFAIILIISFLIFGRSWIADRLPFMDRVYGVLHIYVNHYHGGEGLAFEQMRSELRYEGGVMKLYVEGKIHNKSDKVQEIPALLATALGADGLAIESWQIDPPAAIVAPGGEVPFASGINAPHGTAVNVNVGFVEKKDAD